MKGKQILKDYIFYIQTRRQYLGMTVQKWQNDFMTGPTIGDISFNTQWKLHIT